MPSEPNMYFVPSIVSNGQRIRAVADKIYITPLNWTFHRFLEDHAIELIGEEWWLHQEKCKKENKSCLFLYADEFNKAGFDLKQQNPNQKILSVPNTGTRQYWMSLCYDLLCLQQRFALPKKLVQRLKDNLQFQSARYEITVGALLVRAGFDLDWLEPSGEKRSCEFIAKHRQSGLTFGVEAKSRVRDGVLNQKVVSPKSKESKDLLKKALKQTPESGGFLIFIDQNLDPNIGDEELVIQANKTLSVVKSSSPEWPDPFSLIIFTNFPFHYGSVETKYAFAWPPHPKQKLPSEVHKDIEESLRTYGVIPQEI